MKFLVYLFSILLLGACASKEIYYWGNYEDVIYQSYSSKEAVSPNKQIDILMNDYKRSREAAKPVPPGFHAQLGMLYFKVGNQSLAKQNFELEKKKFPESKKLMDRFIRKL